MFDSEFRGDWFLADGEWVQEIPDPYTYGDPAEIISGTDVPIAGFPTGPGLALLLTGAVDGLPDAGVLDRIVGYERLTAWAGAGQARALAELTGRRTADDPNELPYAVEEGTHHLSPEHAALVEEQLLEAAETLSPARLRVKVATLADSLDPREIEDRHQDAAEGRRVIREPREDGMACLWALLPADDAATLWAAINARAETHRDPDDQRTADQRRADALTDLAIRYLSGETHIDPDTGQVGVRPRVPAWAQVQVTLSADLLLGTSTHPATLRGHGPIPTSMAIRLAADAQWQRIIYDPLTGALLDAGTTRHDPPPALREYVLARDGACTWPHCAQPRVDLDHITPYPTGPTTAD